MKNQDVFNSTSPGHTSPDDARRKTPSIRCRNAARPDQRQVPFIRGFVAQFAQQIAQIAPENHKPSAVVRWESDERSFPELHVRPGTRRAPRSPHTKQNRSRITLTRIRNTAVIPASRRALKALLPRHQLCLRQEADARQRRENLLETRGECHRHQPCQRYHRDPAVLASHACGSEMVVATHSAIDANKLIRDPKQRPQRVDAAQADRARPRSENSPSPRPPDRT